MGSGSSTPRAERGRSGGAGNGEEEDTFGANEEDWHLYKQMARTRGEIGGDESESEQEKEELQWLERLLHKYDPKTMQREQEETNYPQARDFQIELFVERVKPPEVIYQPSIIGLEHAGLSEALEGVFRNLGHKLRDRVCRNVVVMGGNSLHPNFCDRIFYHVRSACPAGLPVKVTHANDPKLGAWGGAKLFALSGKLPESSVTREAYEQKGRDYLEEHEFSNPYHPTPKA
mmetsp:Transcript_768/g.1541  ORF Transcript_768/g.1541 Transcript_768/m.1541 type:complete len:231 (+) Transcript_768:1548-2240(+)